MLQGAYYFTGPFELPGLYDSLFGGLFQWKAIPSLLQMLVLAFVSLALYRIANGKQIPRFLLVLLFLSVCVFTTSPWDELFVNLRHAENWAAGFGFSFNQLTQVEGTVDFLPYWMLALAHRWFNLPLVEGALVMSALGGLVILALFERHSLNWKNQSFRSLFLLCTSLFPPLLYNSSQGFSTTWFGAVAIYVLLSPNLRHIGRNPLVALSFLPLIRTEGIWLVLLVQLVQLKPKTQRLKELVLTLIPFALMSVWRWQTFHHLLPTPIAYKSAFGSAFYFLLGMRNLLADLICTLALPSLLAWWLLERNKKAAVPLILVGLFVLPYYLSGGDWFPPHWGRYLLPGTLLIWFFFWRAASEYWSQNNQRHRLFAASLLFVPIILWSQTGVRRLITDLSRPRKTLALLESRHSGHARLQALSRLGNLLRDSTTPGASIGTSEVATVMFFAQREAIDFLGVANPLVAQFELRRPPNFLRKHPHSELPYSIFRRTKPTYLAEALPDILYLFDFTIPDLFQDLRVWELTEDRIPQAVERWKKKFEGLYQPLYGSLTDIERLGYRATIVRSGDSFCNLYFVHERQLKHHREALKRMGLSERWLKF